MNNSLTNWFAVPGASVLLYGGGALLLLVAVVLAWLWLGPGPRRWRRYRTGQKALRGGDWAKALEEFRGLHQQDLLAFLDGLGARP
jgi:hypothetical protein